MKLFEAVSRNYKVRGWEFVIELIFIGSLFFAYWPLTRWLFKQTFGHEQFLQALIVIVLAATFVVLDRGPNLKPTFDLDSFALRLFGISLGVVVAGSLTGWAILIPLAFCLALAGGCSYTFGKQTLKHAYPLLIVFFFYIVLMALYPVLDFPLRAYAANYSAFILKALQLGPELYLQVRPDPALFITVNGMNFEVAPECNGFGLMSTSFLLSVLLAMKSKDKWWARVLGIVSAVFLGSVGNLLRIVIIILLAPLMPNYYLLMHEVVGLAIFFSTLLLIGWLLWQKSERLTR